MSNNVSLKSVIAGFEKEYGREHTELSIHTYGSTIGVVTKYDNGTNVEFQLKHRDDRITLYKSSIFPAEVLAQNTADITVVHSARDNFMDKMPLDENYDLTIDLESEFLMKLRDINRQSMINLKKEMTTWNDNKTSSENMMELIAGRRALEKQEKLQAFLDEHCPSKKVIKPAKEKTSHIDVTDNTSTEPEITKS